jgi:uncharacterized protein YndB with AHSA1/START domain/DNA-binding transcriptional ArsR family regulator
MSHLSTVWAKPEPAPAASSDDIFKALADPSRRVLLDSLFVHDGQTLFALCGRLPGMTRFGVMKHLRLLEAAGLVLTRKVGREKLHYLNPVPIRLVHDRWIGKYAEAWVGALSDLKADLEGATMDRPRHVYQVYIRAEPDDVWQAITDPKFTQRFFFQTRVNTEWRPGAPLTYWTRDGTLAVEGEVLETDPPRRLVTTWAFRHQPELAVDPPSRVTWEIEPLGEMCRLTLVHDNFPSETATYRSVGGGWPLVLSSLKSLLETGEPLPSLRR